MTKIKKPQKTEAERQVKGGLNFRMDGHKQFCKRCFAFNKKCPNTGNRIKDGKCGL